MFGLIVWFNFSSFSHWYATSDCKIARESNRQYRDSLVSSNGVMVQGNSEELITLASAAVKKTKTQLKTIMQQHLAIVDPQNGAEFISEVEFLMSLMMHFSVRL